jgi:hypothetical protein
VFISPQCLFFINHKLNTIYCKKVVFFAISKVESLLFCVVLAVIIQIYWKYFTILVYIFYCSILVIMILQFAILLQGLDLIQNPTLWQPWRCPLWIISPRSVIITKGVNIRPNKNELQGVVLSSKQGH